MSFRRGSFVCIVLEGTLEECVLCKITDGRRDIISLNREQLQMAVLQVVLGGIT